MAKYTDCNGNEWELRLTVAMLGRLRTDAGFSLGKEMAGERIVETLFGDPETFAKVLWVMCDAQAKARTITPEQFVSGIDAKALDDAAIGLMEAITDFFHRPAAAQAMKKRLPELMAKADREIAEAADAAMNRLLTLRTGPTDSAGSAELTPGP